MVGTLYTEQQLSRELARRGMTHKLGDVRAMEYPCWYWSVPRVLTPGGGASSCSAGVSSESPAATRVTVTS